MFLYLAYTVILGQLSLLLLTAFLSSEHMSLLVPALAFFLLLCVSGIKMIMLTVTTVLYSVTCHLYDPLYELWQLSVHIWNMTVTYTMQLKFFCMRT